MRVAPGTHLQPLLPHVETRAEDNLLSRGQEVAADVKEEDALDVVLAPGEMSLHHVNIIHGSNANRSDRPRVGFAIRFTTPEVTPDPLTAHGMLVRGKDRYGHFRLFDPPKKRPLKEAFEAQRKDAREQYEALQSTKGQFENPRV